MTWLPWLGSIAFLLAAGAVGVAACGARRWADATLELTRKLDATRLDANANAPLPARYDPRELEGLPAPEQRYFRAVLTAGKPVISVATIELAGMFKPSATGEQWKSFTSRQRMMTRRLGFLLGARGAMPLGLIDAF